MAVGLSTVCGVALVAGGCSAVFGVFGGARGPRPTHEDGEITYRAVTRFVGVAPVRIRTVVLATNGGGEAVEVRAVGCSVFVRLYTTSDRTGFPAWDERLRVGVWRSRTGREEQDEGGDGICRRRGAPLVVPPGESRSLMTTEVVPAVIGDTIHPGRYYFTAIVPLDGGSIEFISGAAELEVADVAPSGSAHVRSHREFAGSRRRSMANAAMRVRVPAPPHRGPGP